MYDVVFASNVLNVQLDEQMLRTTCAEIADALDIGGFAVMNYPLSPRKSSLSNVEVVAILKEFFTCVDVAGGSNAAPMWECYQ